MLTWIFFNSISGTSWFYFCKSLSWMTDDILFVQHLSLNPPDSFLQFLSCSLGTYDFIIFLRGPTPPGCTPRELYNYMQILVTYSIYIYIIISTYAICLECLKLPIFRLGRRALRDPRWLAGVPAPLLPGVRARWPRRQSGLVFGAVPTQWRYQA